jgi:hypothetical protein
MTKAARALTLISLLLICYVPGAAAQSRLIVFVYGDMHRPEFDGAMDKTAAIFQGAGIDVTFVDCSADPRLCDSHRLKPYQVIAVRFAKSQVSSARKDHAAGFSWDGSIIATVYPLTLLGATACDPATFLSRVIAHELGHALGLHHARSGIMRRAWTNTDLKTINDWTFTERPHVED